MNSPHNNPDEFDPDDRETATPGPHGHDGDDPRHNIHYPHERRGFGNRFPGNPQERMPGGMPGGPARFGRFGPGSMPFGGPHRRRKGAARDAILSLLSEKPFNGYGLIKEISERTSDTWHPSPGSIYPTLQQLVDEGLIEPTTEDKRTDFQLTDDGRAYADAHAAQYAQLWQTAAEHSEVNGDIRVSMGKLLGVAQQYRFAATPEQREQAVKLIDETRRALYRILGE